MTPTRDWSPFKIAAADESLPHTRAIENILGIGDRLRTAAFAEFQAREAFLWAAHTFADASESLRQAWRELAAEENKHMNWLLTRMTELGTPIDERPVSDQLWVSLTRCSTARDFALYMASAEERGRKAGERFYKALEKIDPTSAQIFGTIAKEEVRHIELAQKYFDSAQPSADGTRFALRS